MGRVKDGLLKSSVTSRKALDGKEELTDDWESTAGVLTETAEMVVKWQSTRKHSKEEVSKVYLLATKIIQQKVDIHTKPKLMYKKKSEMKKT